MKFHGSERQRCSMEMAKAIILILSVSVFTAQSAVLINEDIVHTRVARSPCYSCDHNYGPPPPPPVFRTHNWSGYARSTDGTQQGVFSGATAATGSGNEASGQAFSLAASDVGSANNAQSDQSAKFADKYSHGAYGGNLQNTQSNMEGLNSASTSQNTGFETGQSNIGTGFEYGQSESGQHPVKLVNEGKSKPGAETSANAQAGGQEQIQYPDYGSKSVFSNQGAAGVQGQYQGSEHKETSAYHDQPGPQSSEQFQGFRHNEVSVNRGDIADLQQRHSSANTNSFAVNRGEAVGQEQNKELGLKQFSAYNSNEAGLGGNQNFGPDKSNSYHGGARGHGQAMDSAQQEVSSYHGNTGGYGQVPASSSQATSEYNSNAGQGQQFESNYARGGYRRRSGSGRYGASEHGKDQSVLGGALDLASQGLKAAEGTQDGCSTCGKNSYAISNARSHSGSAVALSVGG